MSQEPLDQNQQQPEEEIIRELIIPHSTPEETSPAAPFSNRRYEQLESVQHDRVQEAKAMVDNVVTVMTPMGGLIQMGYRDEITGGFVLDDLMPVPRTGEILDYCQVPIMVDAMPALEHDEEKEIDFGRLPAYEDYESSSKGQAKADEQVLAVAAWPLLRDMMNPGTAFRPADLGQRLYSTLAYIRRGWCEKDERFIQLLPYLTFWKKVDGRIQLFTYQRGKGVGEGRLAMNCSVGVGGHVNPIDFLSMQSRLTDINVASLPFSMGVMTNRLLTDGFWTGIMMNVFRETSEEIKVTDGALGEVDMAAWIYAQAQAEETSTEQWLYRRTSFFLDYAATEVERHHLMMSIAIELPEDFEVATNEEELNDVGFRDLEILYKLQVEGDQVWLPTPLEHWSRSVVTSLYETVGFLAANTNLEMPSSRYMREKMRADGVHPLAAEDVAKIPQDDRWKIGTLAGSFGDEYRFYAMNMFVRA